MSIYKKKIKSYIRRIVYFFFLITFTFKQGALETRDKHFSNKTLIMMSVL